MGHKVVRFVVGSVAVAALGCVGIEVVGGGRSPHRGSLEAAPSPEVARANVLPPAARYVADDKDAVRTKEVDPASVPTRATAPKAAYGAAGGQRSAAGAQTDDTTLAAERQRCGVETIRAGAEPTWTWSFLPHGRKVDITFSNTGQRLIKARGAVLEFPVPDSPAERREVKTARADLCPGEEVSWTVVLSDEMAGDPRVVEER